MCVHQWFTKFVNILLHNSNMITSYSGADPEFGKKGGTLLKKSEEQKKKKKKKVTTIIASYPLPNIFYHVCYVK